MEAELRATLLFRPFGPNPPAIDASETVDFTSFVIILSLTCPLLGGVLIWIFLLALQSICDEVSILLI